jgi:hypothetical protein
MLKMDPVHIAIMLQEFLRVEAAPVIVVRDHNRPQFLSMILSAMAAGLKSLMLAWGDDYPSSASATSVRDYSDLASAIAEASLIRSRARESTKFLAPVNIENLKSPEGVLIANGRLKSGADLLLAQPPTTDAGETFDRHLSLVDGAGLIGKVFLNVFPFKDIGDARRYEKKFGWKISESLDEATAGSSASLLEMEREVVHRSREAGFGGIYLSTRGEPTLAERILS